MDHTQTTEEYLKWLIKDTKSFEKTKDTYALKSEYYRMMYARTLEIESIEKALKYAKK